MTETTDKNSEKRGEARKPISLKGKVSQGTVRQSFSHGRTKTVVVETKKKRAEGGAAKPEAQSVWTKPAAAPKAEAPVAKAPEPAPAPAALAKGQVLRTLTEDERVARVRALEEARIADAEAK